MCGLCGIFNAHSAEAVAPELIRSMANTITHRGPDAEGVYIDRGVGLGHRRLSIIDLASGHQPMQTEDESVVVVFNGEIYNYRELKERLIQKGYRFRTQSDTEVILFLYQEEGEQCFASLRGMFSIALWDKKRRRLVLARDRVGEKPLFYHYDGKRCVFASEMKAILEVPGIPREIDLQALSDYLSLLYVPAPKTIFQSIRKVRPAHYLVISDSECREVPYWDLQFSQDDALSEAEWAEQLIELYREAVKIRLMSEVPLGAFLSGGVDSSSVVALMSEIMAEPVITSSIGFSEKEFDELDYARRIAQQFHTKHYEQVVQADAAGIIEKLVWHYDEPFADSSAVPTYYVSAVARHHVTVALSGDGGDEIFAGYRRYRLDQSEHAVRAWIPAGVRRVLFGGLSALYPKADWAPRYLRGKATFKNLSCSHIEAYFRSMSACSPELKSDLLSGDVRARLKDYHTVDLFRDYYARAGTADPLSRIQYVDIKTYLPDDILVKVDRASMANSLEVRCPLLDHKLIEFAARMPSSLKLSRGIGKKILKQALEPILPKEILHRPKMGFGVPLATWLRKDLKQLAADALLPQCQDGLLDQDRVRQLWDEHQRGFRNRATELWALMMFRLWQKRFC